VAKLKVAVSPFFAKDFFVDEVSGIKFEKSNSSAVYPYDISNETKLEGIRKAVRTNILWLLEGTLPEEEVPVAKPAPTPVVEEPKAEAPAEEVVAEVEVEEAPKSKGTKKVSK
jgi:hypothetical protein